VCWNTDRVIVIVPESVFDDVINISMTLSAC